MREPDMHVKGTKIECVSFLKMPVRHNAHHPFPFPFRFVREESSDYVKESHELFMEQRKKLEN